MQVYYATRDGQSRRIAAHIADRLSKSGIAAPPLDLAEALPTPPDLAQARLIVLLASVRYGRHLPEAERFLTVYQQLPAPVPLVLISVNLTARKPDKRTAATNPYLRKLIARHRLQPVLATALAGRLDYPRYRFWDRQIIRFIMLLTGGATDPSACIEYTSWEAVDDLAARIADLRGRIGCGGI
jgi:menaquinone-dependent protoporphyrinogen oxidase